MADLIAELADCPFCGGEAMHREETTATKDCCHYVRCRPCGAETALQPTPEIAAYAWNRRNAEIAAAVRDAARYRHVRLRLWPGEVEDAVDTYPGMAALDMAVCEEHGKQIDATIDAAMAQEGAG